MNSVHLVIPDLFLPKDIATEACADLRLHFLEKMLGRGATIKLSPSTSSGRTDDLGASTGSARTGDFGISLENHLCGLFGMAGSGSAPVAAVSAAFDGLGEGCWLRADPVHLSLQRDRMLLLPNPDIAANEAEQMCASLSEHFAGQGMEFFAPHPLRWYVRFDVSPDFETVPLTRAYGRNVHGLLPRGEAGLRWHQVFNEIQMLLHAHPLNETREQRGKLAINSVWFWGGGSIGNAKLQKHYGSASSDDVLVEMFATAAGVPFAAWSEQWDDTLSLTPLRAPRAWLHPCTAAAARGMPRATPPPPQRERGNLSDGKQLLVWTGLRSALQRGDLDAWRAALQDFETGYAQPLWRALRSGKIDQLQMDVIGEENIMRVMLKRVDTWAFWRRSRHLPEYSV